MGDGVVLLVLTTSSCMEPAVGILHSDQGVPEHVVLVSKDLLVQGRVQPVYRPLVGRGTRPPVLLGGQSRAVVDRAGGVGRGSLTEARHVWGGCGGLDLLQVTIY